MCNLLVHNVGGARLRAEGLPGTLVVERRFPTDQLDNFVSLQGAAILYFEPRTPADRAGYAALIAYLTQRDRVGLGVPLLSLSLFFFLFLFFLFLFSLSLSLPPPPPPPPPPTPSSSLTPTPPLRGRRAVPRDVRSAVRLRARQPLLRGAGPHGHRAGPRALRRGVTSRAM